MPCASASPLPFSLCLSSSSPCFSYTSPNDISSPLRSPLLPLSSFPHLVEQSPSVVARSPLCTCLSDRLPCDICVYAVASSSVGDCKRINAKNLIRDAGTPPKPSSPMKAWRSGDNSVANVAKPVMDCNTAASTRSVLSVRTDNHLRGFASKTLSCAVGSLASSLKEQLGSMVGNIKCHRDRPHGVDGNEISISPSKESSTPFKRKRPPKLNIPDSPNSVTPAGFQEPIKELSAEGLYYAVFCKKGKREVMEDAHRAITDFQGQAKQAFFGVFDGHGGRSAVDFVAEHLPQEIVNAIESSGNREDCVEQSVTAAFLSTDSGFLLENVDSGASCAAVLVRKGYLVVANAGDCRVVMSRRGKAEALTQDHKAGREDERQRIESLGGYIGCFNGVWRVQGVLAVSRGFGDRHLKDFISAKPDVKKLSITSDCDFLILASDGLWDKVGNQEAVDCARSHLEESQKTKVNAATIECNEAKFSPTLATTSACKKLVEMAASRGSVDDISVIIVHLQHFCQGL